ncbi:MAG: SGNH/GDSL hydrolase family protein [Streptosporangiaceae bacterium]
MTSLAVSSYLAIGDSFTEGVGDPDHAGGCRGWADRFAERLAGHSPGARYANLAIRGKLLGQVATEQVPAAIALRPDLVSLAAGGNDLLRPRADPDSLAATFDDAVSRMRAAGSQVLLFTGFDPGTFPLLRMIRGKAAAFNMNLRQVASRRDCLLVDLWTMTVLTDPRMWCDDRLHLAPEGHRRVALRVCEAVGVPVDADWREPPASAAGRGARLAAGWLAARRQDARWAREHAAPWVSRRLRGVSSGDGIEPKRPELRPF